jgi:hypothetical protein
MVTDLPVSRISKINNQAALKKSSPALKIYRFFTMKLFGLFSNLTVQVTFFVVLLASSGYIYLFGESGYYTIQELKKDIYQVSAITEELRRENGELNEKYLILAEKTSGEKEAESSVTPGAIILKFDETHKSQQNRKQDVKPEYKPGEKIAQIRILYGFSAFVFTVLFAYFFQKIRKWKLRSAQL